MNIDDDFTAQTATEQYLLDRVKELQSQLSAAEAQGRALGIEEDYRKRNNELANSPVVGLLTAGIAISMHNFNSITDSYVKSCWNGALELILRPPLMEPKE
jgi:hypothetical protein